MRAAVTSGPGGPVEVGEVNDLPPAAGEVLVRVQAAGVGELDRAVFEGVGPGRDATFPLVQGTGIAGVVEVGGVAFQPGMRVVVKPTIPCGRCPMCRSKRRADCRAERLIGVHRHGGWAELVSVPRVNLLVLPAGVGVAEAAVAVQAHPVVLRAMREAGLKDGGTVVATSPAGTVGAAVVQLASTMGATTLVAVGNGAEAALVEDLGGVAVDSGGKELAGLIVERTEGEGARLVIDAAGDPAVLEPAVEALGHGGRLVVMGHRPRPPFRLDPGLLAMRRLAVLGAGSATDADFWDAFHLLDEHAISPVIARRHPLEEIGAALEEVADRRDIGGVVVDVAGDGR